MITENISTKVKGQPYNSKDHRVFRIVKQAKNSLVISNGKQELIFKKYLMQDERVCKRLERRFHLKHDSLIQIKSIEYGAQKNQLCSDSEDLYCGVLFQRYVKTMQESIKENITFSHQEVISTIAPIKQVVDFMVHHNYDPGELTFSSIVCTDSYEIKFIDSAFHESSIISKDRQSFATNIYSQLAQIMFVLLFPQQKQAKSWRRRYEIAKEHLDQQHFHFFQEVYKKFASINSKSSKSRKIKKQQNSKIAGNKIPQKSDIDSPKKSMHEVIVGCQSGKQNLIIQ